MGSRRSPGTNGSPLGPRRWDSELLRPPFFGGFAPAGLPVAGLPAAGLTSGPGAVALAPGPAFGLGAPAFAPAGGLPVGTGLAGGLRAATFAGGAVFFARSGLRAAGLAFAAFFGAGFFAWLFFFGAGFFFIRVLRTAWARSTGRRGRNFCFAASYRTNR